MKTKLFLIVLNIIFIKTSAQTSTLASIVRISGSDCYITTNVYKLQITGSTAYAVADWSIQCYQNGTLISESSLGTNMPQVVITPANICSYQTTSSNYVILIANSQQVQAGMNLRFTKSLVINAQINPPTISNAGSYLHSTSTTNQWYRCTTFNSLSQCTSWSSIAGATSQNYTPTSNGYYSCVTTNNGCTSPRSNAISFSALDISQFDSQNDIVIYPNPVNNILHIDINKEFLGKIYDITGKMLLTVNTKDIDVSSLTSGIYFLDIYSEDKHYVSKIVKD